MDKKEIAAMLRDYHWMINEIKRQRQMLEDAGGASMTAQYGVEASLPKPQHVNSDPVAKEVVRRNKKQKWIEKLEEKVSFIQKHMTCITNERELAVLECLLDGMSMIAITRHMQMSRRNIYEIRNAIVDKIAHFAQIAHNA